MIAKAVETRGPDLGNAHCLGCGWSYELHPLDAEGVDVGRCPTEAESKILDDVLNLQGTQLVLLVQAMPREPR